MYAMWHFVRFCHSADCEFFLSSPGGQQQFATQTLRVHLHGVDGGFYDFNQSTTGCAQSLESHKAIARRKRTQIARKANAYHANAEKLSRNLFLFSLLEGA